MNHKILTEKSKEKLENLQKELQEKERELLK